MPTRFKRHIAPGTRTQQQARADHDRARKATSPWRAWYGTQRWRRRAAGQLAANPLCIMCEGEGRITPATVADHVERHQGNPDKFWCGRLQSLCAHHHNSVKAREEGRGAQSS